MQISIFAGKCDPILHGHCDAISKSSHYGDYLIIITHKDYIVAKTSDKGFCAMPLYYRMLLLRGLLLALNIKGEVMVGIDEDGTVINTLGRIREIYPNEKIIYCKGGDRNSETMNIEEWNRCGELEIEVEFGVGDLLSSSSKLFERMGNKIET